MGNTYDSILEVSEQRWYAERITFMSSMEQTLKPAQLRENHKKYVVEVIKAQVPHTAETCQSIFEMLNEFKHHSELVEQRNVEQYL